MVTPLAVVVVVASVVDAVATSAAVKRAELLTVPRQLVAMPSNTEEATDALTTRDARSTARAPRVRLPMAARSKDVIIARSTTRTRGSTSITTLRDPNTITRLR